MNEIAMSQNNLNMHKKKIAYPPIGDQLDMLWHSIDQDPF
ncbi:MAG: hypothetical protein CM15mV128_190 [Caudoviricetes sp.]|nr:MAG: hypothetical protein CM15mV128_190 [Caudoviricetes sp.]